MHIKNIIKYLSIFLILSIYIALPAIGKDAEIRWKKVNRSYGYIVTIKNTYNKIIFRRQTNKTYINFSIPEGTYFCKISVLNKFRKISVSTKWFKIKIKISQKPYIDNISKKEFNKSELSNEFTIVGKNFLKGCKIFFIKDEKEIIHDNFNIISQEKITVKINPSNFDIGYYNLKISNPSKEYSIRKNAVYIGINPSISSLTPNIIARRKEKIKIKIRGNNFLSNCYVKFEKDGQSYSVDETNFISKNEVSILLAPSKMFEGEYDIIIFNSENFFDRNEKSLKIIPAIEPTIRSFSPLTMRRKDKQTKITIRGNKIKKGARISLIKNNSVYKSLNLEVISEKKAVTYLNTSTISPGTYTIKIINPGETSSTYKKTLKIKKPYVPLGIYLGFAWGYNVMLPEWDSIIQGSFYGFNFYLGYEPPAFNKVPFIRNIGFELNFDFMKYPYVSSSIDAEDNFMVMSTGIGLFYNNNFKLPVFFLIRVGGGISYTMMHLITTTSEINSETVDPYVYCGFAVRYVFLKHGFIEVGPDYQFINYVNQNMHQLKIYLRIGTAF